MLTLVTITFCMISWMMGSSLVLLALTSRLSSLSSEQRGGRWSGMSRTSCMVSALYRARVHASNLSVGSGPSQSSDTPPPSAWQNLLEQGLRFELALIFVINKRRVNTFIYFLGFFSSDQDTTSLARTKILNEFYLLLTFAVFMLAM